MISLNGEPFTLPGSRITIAGLLSEIHAPRRGVAVAVDAQVVPRSEWESFVVPDEANVEVLTAVQGG